MKSSILFSLLLLSGNAFATNNYLVAKCSVSDCNPFGKEASGRALCASANLIDVYQYVGDDAAKQDRGLFGFNDAAETAPIGNVALTDAKVVESRAGYTVLPDGGDFEQFEILKGLYKESRMKVYGLVDKSAGAVFKLRCSTE